MNKEDIIIYLRMLGEELQKQDVTGEILVIDDMIVLLDIRRPRIYRDTRAYFAGDDSAIQIPKDIDAYFGSHGVKAREAISIIANREGLPHDWWMYVIDPLFYISLSKTWIEYPGIRVYVPVLQYALAMCVATANNPQDTTVIKRLADKLRITTPREMQSYVVEYITEELFTSDMQLTINACFQKTRRPVGRRRKEKVNDSTDA